jgi:hypothetical protein
VTNITIPSYSFDVPDGAAMQAQITALEARVTGN